MYKSIYMFSIRKAVNWKSQFDSSPNPLVFILLIFYIFLITACQPSDTEFNLLSPQKTGISFVNEITESDSLNILVSEFVYNGGGVATGDLNNDGLEDLFFAGNQVDNVLYLNRGKLKFKDISEAAGIQKKDALQWSSGVNILDINLDGKLDIYVCNTLRSSSQLRKNLLYINQGNNEDGIPTFKEQAQAYGVDDPSHSSHAQFFDYDNDGDLDLFVGVNWIEDKYPSQFKEVTNDGSDPNRDNLFQNNWDKSLGHPVFKDVSLETGIVYDGYSHSTLIHDFNEDGWQDIYVANDYQSNDLIFINNQNGTFSNRAGEIFKHFSLSAMGSDVGDINNDGEADFFTTEMQPYYNKRKKLFQGGSNYQHLQFTEKYDYEYQYTRNTLQLNNGINPVTGLPIFSEVGMYAKVQETDWSWTVLFADYDNDGYKDIYITNGFPKDVTDHDFSDFRLKSERYASNDFLLKRIPEIKSPNFLFRNQGDLQFENVAQEWGLEIPSFTNGAAYADFDNDGDLDLVTNNIDDPAFVFENKSKPKNYLRVKLTGPTKNPDAFGAAAEVFYANKRQKNFLLSGRGYLSKSENVLHFGLGDIEKIDSLLITWPAGEHSLLRNVDINQLVEVNYQDAEKIKLTEKPVKPLFSSVAPQYNLLFKSKEVDFIDFNYQRTIPHKFSQYGPSMAVADINGDDLEDVFLGGSGAYPETWMIQQQNGQFLTQEVNYKQHPEAFEEDMGSLLFDADLDGDNDLYIVRGSSQYTPGSDLYQDVLYLNDGKGNFSYAEDALPTLTANGSCIKGADFDQDGDIDLFIGSRVLPFAYPTADRSYVLRNDSKPGLPKFTDITETISPDLLKPGLISDAIWTDFNGDHWPDLILAAEWMPIKVFENQNGQSLKEITENTGLEENLGWWNSLAAADFDQDGDMDYVAGNFGENLYYRCTSTHPVRVYGKDFDNNGMIDPLIACYWKDSLGQVKEYFYHPRQDMINQLVGIRKSYNTYGEYGEATVSDMFPADQMEGATILSANWMKSAFIENLGNGKFKMTALPLEAQLAPIYGILTYDVNGDGLLDVLLSGNDHGMEVIQGRADALNGLVLINKGQFQFDPVEIAKSHFSILGDGVGLAQLSTANNETLILATQNEDSLKAFKPLSSTNASIIKLTDNEVQAKFYLSNGQYYSKEFYWGSGFMAQSGRLIIKSEDIKKVEILNAKGEVSREIQ